MTLKSYVKNIVIFSAAALLVGSHVVNAGSEIQGIRPCTSVLGDSTPETICVTTKGFQFKRYFNRATFAIGWEDIGPEGKGGFGGKIWYDFKPHQSLTQPEAAEFCRIRKLDLPSAYPTFYNGKYNFPNRDSDYVVADRHGFIEVLKNIRGQWLWSSSSDPGYPEGAFVFFADNGDINVDSKEYWGHYGTVRCVGISGVNH